MGEGVRSEVLLWAVGEGRRRMGDWGFWGLTLGVGDWGQGSKHCNNLYHIKIQNIRESKYIKLGVYIVV